MKLFSPKGVPLNRATARNATLLNLLATPGLGSLLGRRWIAGTGQLILAIVSCIMIIIWVFKEMAALYSTTVFSETTTRSPSWKSLQVGAILFAIAWAWSAVTSISLLREASAGKERSLENFAAPPVQKLDESKIFTALASVPDWKLQGATISRTFQFKDFPAAIKFVEAVAGLAEEAWHHPDIDIRWNKVTLTLSTHDAGGLTEKDFALAQKFDKL